MFLLGAAMGLQPEEKQQHLLDIRMSVAKIK
jgi:hypothetical protein